ncbi:MAG: VCBS repeat-containing protein [Polyangiaceae bacterium]
MVDWVPSRSAELRACVAGICLLAACGRSELSAGSADFDFASGGAAARGFGGQLSGGRAAGGSALNGGALNAGGGRRGAGGSIGSASGGTLGAGGKASQAGGRAGAGGGIARGGQAGAGGEGGYAGEAGAAGEGGQAGAGGEAGHAGNRCPHGMMLGEPPLTKLAEPGYWRVAVSGDFNRDGVLDVATATEASRMVRILFGAGDGSFAAGREFDAGGNVYELLAVDVDSDGRLDFIAQTLQGVSVWLDKPEGFSQRLVRNTPAGLSGIRSADMNSDGRPDLIAANSAADELEVRLGVGDGTFLERQQYSSGTRPVFVTAGDLNRDGKLDLVSVSTEAETLNVLLSHGDGTFAAPVAYPTPLLADRVELGDLNSDGALDLVVGPPRGVNGAVRRVWLGHGDGSFGAPTDTPMEPSWTWALSDVDGDGRLDLMTVPDRAVVSVRAGVGDGSFAPAVAHGAIWGAAALLFGDANNDQRPDIVAVSGFALFTLSNLGSGRFLTRTALLLDDTVGAVKAADLDLDGNPDLVSTSGRSVSHFLNQGARLFTPGETIPLGDFSDSLAVADFNRDGYPDRAVAMYGTGFRILWGGAGGRVVGSMEYPLTNVQRVAAGDLNADGFADIVLTLPDSIVVYLGPTFAISSAYPSAESYWPVTIADVSGDGKLDVISAHAKSSTIGVFLGDGHGALAPPVETTVGTSPNAVAFADLDGDGRVEGVVADDLKSNLHVLSNEGNGKFSIRRTYEGVSGRELAIADIDGDGILDVLAVNQSRYSVDLLRGLGNGVLAPVESYPTGSNPVSLAVTDLDADGRPDVAVAVQNEDRLDLLFNRCR